jgi:hypothetical protein
MPKFFQYLSAPTPALPKPQDTDDPLTSNAEWVSESFATSNLSEINGSVFADQSGTLYIEQSPDGTNWDVSTEYIVPTGDGRGFSEEILLPYTRVRYLNGGTAQMVFRLYFNFV